MLVIGLTGPSGAGKGEVSALFASYGLPIINADRIYHELLSPPSSCLKELTKEFGGEILTPSGELDRPKLSALVFTDPKALTRLNSIAHRYVMEEIRRQLELLRRTGARAAVLDAPHQCAKERRLFPHPLRLRDRKQRFPGASASEGSQDPS